MNRPLPNPFASVSKRVSWLNYSCETFFHLQVHFHANQTYFHKEKVGTKTRIETEAQGN